VLVDVEHYREPQARTTASVTIPAVAFSRLLSFLYHYAWRKQKLSPITFSETMDILTESAVIRATAHLLARLAFGNCFSSSSA